MEGETTIQPVVLLEECVESLPVWVLYVVLPIYGGAIVLLVILGVLTFLLAKKTKTRIEEEYEEHSESESERESIDMDEMRELYEVIPDEYMKRDSFASSDPRSSLHQINEEEEDDENEDDAYKEEMDEPISDEISDSSLVKNIDNMQPQASPDLLSSLSHQSSPSFIPLKRLYSENKGDPERGENAKQLVDTRWIFPPDDSQQSKYRPSSKNLDSIEDSSAFELQVYKVDVGGLSPVSSASSSICSMEQQPNQLKKRRTSKVAGPERRTIQRSVSQRQADFALRMLSRPEDYEDGIKELNNSPVEKRSPTGRKLSELHLITGNTLGVPRHKTGSRSNSSSSITDTGRRRSTAFIPLTNSSCFVSVLGVNTPSPVSSKESQEADDKNQPTRVSNRNERASLPRKLSRASSYDAHGYVPRVVGRRSGIIFTQVSSDNLV